MKRIWLITGTAFQALLTMAAALAIWKSGQPSIASDRGAPSWTNVLTFVGLAFMSASLGVQGIQGKRLNTQFGTTSTFSIELRRLIHLLKRCHRLSCPDNDLGRTHVRSEAVQVAGQSRLAGSQISGGISTFCRWFHIKGLGWQDWGSRRLGYRRRVSYSHCYILDIRRGEEHRPIDFSIDFRPCENNFPKWDRHVP